MEVKYISIVENYSQVCALISAKKVPEFKFPPKNLNGIFIVQIMWTQVPVYFIKGSNKCNFSMPLKTKIFFILYHFLLYTASFNMTFNNG